MFSIPFILLLGCRMSTDTPIFWEMTSGWMPCSARYLVRQWIQIYVSLRRLVGFHALREGGSRIPRSILPCPCGCGTIFTHFHCEGGPFTRQSTIEFIRISHIFPIKRTRILTASSRMNGRVGFLPHFAAFFGPSAWT